MSSPIRTMMMLAASAALAACSQPAAPDPLQEELDSLRTLTKPYESIDAARAAGYAVKITDCMADTSGAMGLHYGKAAIIDGTVNAREPEVMMYEPQASGQLKLVGVEYVVPLTAWTAATPPQLYGQTFQRNEMFQVWALHAWIWKENPRGTFASWNPLVSCAHASAVS
ncbi:MAG: hypothetical protein ACREMA_08105 [Longimicrobiales bacterium]